MKRLVAALVMVMSAAWILIASPAGAETRPTWSGSCHLTGTMTFHLPLSLISRSGSIEATASGTCSGALVDTNGVKHNFFAHPAQYFGYASRSNSTCASGTTYAGSFALVIDGVKLDLIYTDYRVYNNAAMNILGLHGGHATGTEVMSAATMAQECRTGIQSIAVTITLQTLTTVTG